MTIIELDLAQEHPTVILKNVLVMLDVVKEDFEDFTQNVATDAESINEHNEYIDKIRKVRKILKEI